LGHDATLNPFGGCACYRSIAALPLAERVAELRQASVRQAILGEFGDGRAKSRSGAFLDFRNMYVLGDPPDYEQEPSRSIAAQAERAGVSPAAFAYDRLLEDDGRAMLYFPFLNYADGSLEPSLEMMRHPNAVLGLGDGGAHLGTICDASFPTHMLTHWTRDRRRGAKLPLETVVRWHARETAHAVGLDDRGVLAPGYKADVNLNDYEGLTRREPRMVRDLPAGGRRLVQGADGYRYAIVAGQITYVNGEATRALPGRLVRGAQAAPHGGMKR